MSRTRSSRRSLSVGGRGKEGGRRAEGVNQACQSLPSSNCNTANESEIKPINHTGTSSTIFEGHDLHSLGVGLGLVNTVTVAGSKTDLCLSVNLQLP